MIRQNAVWGMLMALDELLDELVVANHILAHEGVVDALGHVSVRHPERPDRFFLSCSRSPALVTRADIMEFDLDCNPIDQAGRRMYGERPIHGGIYQARPDVMSVVHNHAQELIPYGVTAMKLRQLIHTAGGMGKTIPTWDIRTNFGDTDLLVLTMPQGHDLAKLLGPNSVALMRGHGCAVAGASLRDAVRIAVYVMVNAKLQAEAMRFGEVTYMSDAEIELTDRMASSPLAMDRIWQYWTKRCGG
jgi:HCOMODA/2-hydroxy-3-carboxy-muconic semialdehyde decarboxylase